MDLSRTGLCTCCAGHHRRHINLVKGSQHGCFLSGIQQALGNLRPHAGHGNALFYRSLEWALLETIGHAAGCGSGAADCAALARLSVS